MFDSIKEMVGAANESGKPLSELVIETEVANSGVPRTEVWDKMKRNLNTMRQAVTKGETGEGVHSPTGLTGGEAVKIREYRKHHRTLSGDTMMGGQFRLPWRPVKLMHRWASFVRHRQQDQPEPCRA